MKYTVQFTVEVIHPIPGYMDNTYTSITKYFPTYESAKQFADEVDGVVRIDYTA
jgi:viroplasmin and RNaseH domain-containing protein